MKISEELVREVILEVLQQMGATETAPGVRQEHAPPVQFRETGVRSVRDQQTRGCRGRHSFFRAKP